VLPAGWTEAGFEPARSKGIYQTRREYWRTWNYMDPFLLGDVASGVISADMSGKHEGWFRIQVGSLDQ
jgi:hypothetical protein